MTDAAQVERAERLGLRRARMFALQAVLFVGWQGLFFTGGDAGAEGGAGLARAAGWLVWVCLLLILIATGGALLRGRGVRHLLNDEFTLRHRGRSHVAGFWAAAAASVLLYIVSHVEPVSGREAIHIILSAAIGAALLTFALLERRSRALE